MTASGPPRGGVPTGGADGRWADGRHPGDEEVDALLDADLVEVRDRSDDGVVPPEAQVAAHVLGCARCRDVLADMRAVRSLLRREGAQVPAPPEDLTARIAAAVADEQARARTAHRATRRRHALALAAAVAVLGGGGALVVGEVLGSVGSASLGAAGGGAGAEAAADLAAGSPRQLVSGTDYAPGQVADQLRAALDGRTVELAEAFGGAPGAAPDAGDGGADGGDGGDSSDGTAGPTRGAPATAPAGALAAEDPAALEACLRSLGEGGAPVLAVDAATWEGRPADVLVLPADGGTGGGDDGDLRVWVVGRGCAGGTDGLLHFEVVRP